MLTAGDIVDKVRRAGVVGAGGAGFPTHVKLRAKADTVIVNGAECEPLLYVDQSLMATRTDALIRGLKAAMAAVGATRGIIATKKHYHAAVSALEKGIAGEPAITLHLMDSYYPAGDEKSLIHDVTGQVLPSARLPADIGCVVCNVGTLINVADALDDRPVTDKLVTVTGDVAQPQTLSVPIGTPLTALMAACGFSGSEDSHAVIEGGPLMGHVLDGWDQVVTKTTGAYIVLPRDHHLIVHNQMTVERQVKIAMAVCCQCNMCTIMCPRNALGLHVEPHKAMRAIANGDGRLVGDVNGILACCSCNLCSHYACNFGLTPGTVMTNLKQELQKAGVKPHAEDEIHLDPALETKRIPISRLIARLGLSSYNRPAPLADQALAPDTVRLMLKQHIGRPAEPRVQAGQTVVKGETIADMPPDALGAPIHASLSGRVSAVDGQSITITA